MKTPCSVEGCERFVTPGGGRGLCQTHYMRLRRTGTTDTNPEPHYRKHSFECSREGCDKRPAAFGLCDTHYRAERRAHITRKIRVCRWCEAPIAADAGGRALDCPRCAVLTNKLKPYKDFTVGDYLALYEKQGGRCGCCGRSVAVLDVDHCHDSAVVRGLLCGRCNTGVAFLGDDLPGVMRAVAYLGG